MAKLELNSTEIDNKKALFDTVEAKAYQTWKEAVTKEEDANRQADQIIAEAKEKAESLRTSTRDESSTIKDQAIGQYVTAHDEYRAAYQNFKTGNSLNDELLGVLGYPIAGKVSLSAKKVDSDFRAKYRSELVSSDISIESDTTDNADDNTDNTDYTSDDTGDSEEDAYNEHTSEHNGAAPNFWKRNNR